MELFKLLGTIAIDNSDANKALDDTSQKGAQTESKLSKAFSAVGKGAAVVGKTVMTGLAVGGAAMGTLTVKALNMSGELEQNMGGSEAVFGKYAGKMQETAKSAFSNMGLSTSDYLATANKMGALFQGAGFSIEESMGISSDAMQRAADVASIMGIDTTSAMEAIAGAAKGNFTMMDNLGVAMNDTTLNAYALEKGIGKTTQEMTNQEKIGLAMEMFMEKTAYAAGNYAKENETLAGSLGTAKAALTNFLDGSGDVEGLVTSFSNCANVIVDNIKTLAPRLVTGITDVINQLIPMLPPLLNQLLPVIIEGAVSLINGLVAALPSIISALMSALPTLIAGVQQIITALIQALPQIIQSLVSALPTLIPQLINGIINMIVTLCTMIPQIIQPLIDNLPTIIISIVQALVENLPALIEGLISLVLGIVQALPQIIQALVEALPTVVEMIVTGLLTSLPALIQGCVQLVIGLVQALPQIFMSLVEAVIGIFQGIWEAIKNVFAPVIEWFQGLWDSLGNVPGLSSMKTMIEQVWNAISTNISTVVNVIKTVVTTVWNSIKSVVSTVINSIKNVISTVWNAIKTIISSVMKIISSVLKGDWEGVKSGISNIINAIKSVISSVWNGIKNVISSVMNAVKTNISTVWNAIKTVVTTVINTIKSVISTVWNGIKSTISTVVNGIKNTISGAFNNIKTVVTTIWNGIKTAITNPIETAKNTIKKIVDTIKGFFSGMKISFPKIKMPHFKITPSGWKIGDLMKGSIPKLGVDWYAKAMSNPMIMTKPTVFGYNSATGQLMAGGEAGSEVVAGTNTLMNMIRGAVSGQNTELVAILYKILDAILSLDENMGGHMREALAGTGFEINKREFARLVKAVN